MDADGSSALWGEKADSLMWGSEKIESPLWDTDIKDPSCMWDEDLSRNLAAKLLLIENDQPSIQLIDQQMFTPNNFPYGQDFTTMSTTAANKSFRFKTEICRNFKEKGTCLYGELCQFAHGEHELRKDVGRHNKYKTKPCQKYWILGYCAYGPRCNFIHNEKELPTGHQAQEMIGGVPSQLRRGLVSQPTLYKTVADVIGLANARKSSLGDSGDSGSDEVGAPVRGFNIPTFYPREKELASYRSNFVRDAGPVGSGRPGSRVVWPGV